jgi:hypothetical protein
MALAPPPSSDKTLKLRMPDVPSVSFQVSATAAPELDKVSVVGVEFPETVVVPVFEMVAMFRSHLLCCWCRHSAPTAATSGCGAGVETSQSEDAGCVPHDAQLAHPALGLFVAVRIRNDTTDD